MNPIISHQKSRAIVGVALALCTWATQAHAALSHYEGFNYGPGSGALAGTNGGTGFSGAWTAGNPGITYAAVGLTFSDLAVSGGMATATGTNGIGNALLVRPFSSTLGGVYFGSFLSRVAATSNSTGVTMGTALGLQSSPLITESGFGSFSPSGAFALEAVQGFSSARSGGALGVGRTYLTLFKANTSTRSMTGWVLSAEQYDSLKGGGITETELNAAPIGTGPLQVWARATVNGSQTITASHLKIYMNAGAGVSATLALDEFRIGNASLDEVLPVVAPPTAAIATYAGIEITGTVGSTYRVEFTLDLESPDWTPLADVSLPVSPFIYFDPSPISQSPRRFYRVLISPGN